MMFLRDLFKFRFIYRIGNSYNFNALFQSNLDRRLWVGKLSKSLVRDSFVADFRDLDERALLAHRLALNVGIRTLQTKIIPANKTTNFDIPIVGFEPINKNFFLTRFGGRSLREYLQNNALESIRDLDDILSIFVFNLWVGNYDKKTEDYLVTDLGQMVSIDYQLSGPGFQSGSSYSLGAWGEAYELEDVGDTGWALDGSNGPLMAYIRSCKPQVDRFLPIISKINSIHETKIKQAMDDLRFYYQGTRRELNKDYFDFLIYRRGQIKDAIQRWIDSGYVIGNRPKRNGIV